MTGTKTRGTGNKKMSPGHLEPWNLRRITITQASVKRKSRYNCCEKHARNNNDNNNYNNLNNLAQGYKTKQDLVGKLIHWELFKKIRWTIPTNDIYKTQNSA